MTTSTPTSPEDEIYEILAERTRQAILKSFIPKDKIRAAIGEDEKPDTNGFVNIMAIYNARNHLRAEIRSALELGENDG